jgi:hypothetical protein
MYEDCSRMQPEVTLLHKVNFICFLLEINSTMCHSAVSDRTGIDQQPQRTADMFRSFK